jgi:hypothetical protein
LDGEHASTVLLITPRAELLPAHLDGVAEWEVVGTSAKLLPRISCFESVKKYPGGERGEKRVIFEVA